MTTKERRGSIARRIRQLADRIAEERRDFNTEERAEWDELNAEWNVLASRGDVADADDDGFRTVRVDGREYRVDTTGRGRHLPPDFGPNATGGMLSRRRSAEARATDLDLAVSAWIRQAHGVACPREELEACMRSGFDPRSPQFGIPLNTFRPTTRGEWSFERRDAQATAPGSSGGYLIPGGFIARLERAMKDFGSMMRTSEVMVTADARQMPWPTLDDVSNVGVQLGENLESTEQSLTFGATNFGAYKFSSKLVKASHEMVRDSAIDLAGAVGEALGERLGRILNQRATVGTGAATIHGIVTDAALGVTATSATAIAFDELINLQHSIDPAYRNGGGCSWMMHSDTASYVRRIKDGAGNYLWEPSNQSGQPAMLLGDPVVVNNDMPSTLAASAKPILYGKLSAYKLRLVGQVRFRQLVERYAEYDQIGFLAFLEADGKLLKPSSSASLCPVRYLQMAS